ncbi:MAG: SRPBCC family protein [Acidimicrobiales bacterium]|jgi:uncharacterized protein YndB with AHSA1/START domain
MDASVCPADRVHAPIEFVWELLMRPAGYGRFWNLTVERVEPDGPAAAGQKFAGWIRCRRWRIEGDVLEVDAERHQIRFRTSFPLGIVGDNRIACTPIDGQLHAAIRVRLLAPARVAEPTAGAHGRALSRERRGLAAAAKAGGRGPGAAAGGRERGRRCGGWRVSPPV